MEDSVLVHAPNWLGDSVMCMPALQAFKREYPDYRLSLLARRELAPLWQMHAAVDEIIELAPGTRGTIDAARRVSRRGFPAVFVFPNSFRSAMIPCLARVPVRIGYKGHARRWMLTQVVELPEPLRCKHQAWEYLYELGLAADTPELETPRLAVSDTMMTQCRERLSAVASAAGWVGLIPGAAHGGSKRWPPGHFSDVGRRLIRALKCRILVFGTTGEARLCSQVAGAIGSGALNLAGVTSLREFAGLLRLCRAVVANDSGGMHLAAAAGAPVVAVFGLTDPAKTGPLGSGHRVIAPAAGAGSRDIKPSSPAAERLLWDINPESVAAAALEVIEGRAAAGRMTP